MSEGVKAQHVYFPFFPMLRVTFGTGLLVHVTEYALQAHKFTSCGLCVSFCLFILSYSIHVILHSLCVAPARTFIYAKRHINREAELWTKTFRSPLRSERSFPRAQFTASFSAKKQAEAQDVRIWQGSEILLISHTPVMYYLFRKQVQKASG